MNATAAQSHDQQQRGTRASEAAAVHLDLDGARHIYRMHHWRWHSERDLLYESGLRHALETFEQEHVRATLFLIAEDLGDRNKRDLVREAVQQGHDVASHTVTHRPLTKLSFAEKRREIFESRDRIAEALGVMPRGFRAPAFAIDRDSLLLLQDAGYAYDSSVFSDRAIPGTGAGAMSRPAPAFAGGSLMELPLPSYRPLPLPFHASYSLVLGYWYFDLALRRFCARQAPLILLFHLTDFSDPLPPELTRGMRQRIFTLSHVNADRKRQRCRRMIQTVKKTFSIGSTDRMLEGRPLP